MMKGTYNSVLATEGDVLSICFTSRVIPGGNVKQITARTVYFKVKVGAETVDWATVARTEKLKPMELKLRMLEDNLRALHKEYDYYKEEEQNLRNTNEYMTARVLWMSVIVIVIFVLFSVWQLKHLKKFFKKKRMID
ncbi:COP-coated vesicle membrane protein gp25L precursor [Angomonas deanei]|uniref:Emp24/gp25L/p24 family/GOLD, putative n=1 Tax=Angomonas deanei TaxID=59799 RepID=S9WVL4_9TRYP|nr:COP-coated vesicle membrane protein gp25L precursor [Angomonas deanei]EPY42904.1 COP-coated vesicle membrane protein gp25L precursor [Angomonas deanei]EPY43511.1 COP-coated vesicle membrane protein gp25L precursor [Angomonas deanei]CAD2216874.1 emp24/gp25L/p24 family/GOLD, putative [Angomonas deanei]|eukprot:EPY38812.1 COP-coated vesicle membrane protein gp25L precursor [Angomonas deanei]